MFCSLLEYLSLCGLWFVFVEIVSVRWWYVSIARYACVVEVLIRWSLAQSWLVMKKTNVVKQSGVCFKWCISFYVLEDFCWTWSRKCGLR